MPISRMLVRECKLDKTTFKRMPLGKMTSCRMPFSHRYSSVRRHSLGTALQSVIFLKVSAPLKTWDHLSQAFFLMNNKKNKLKIRLGMYSQNTVWTITFQTMAHYLKTGRVFLSQNLLVKVPLTEMTVRSSARSFNQLAILPTALKKN